VITNTIVSSEKYIKSLLSHVERVKESGGKVVYRINDKMTKSVISEVTKYFSVEPYTIEVKKCARCRNEYDIIIYF